VEQNLTHLGDGIFELGAAEDVGSARGMDDDRMHNGEVRPERDVPLRVRSVANSSAG